MPDAAWGLIGVLLGSIIVFMGNYIVQRRIRKWQIEDERRKVRQEPLKQARQQIQDMISSASKCLVSGVSVSEISRDHLAICTPPLNISIRRMC